MKEKATIQVTLNKEAVDQVLAILAKDEVDIKISDVIQAAFRKVIIDNGILVDGGIPFNRDLFRDVASDNLSETLDTDTDTPIVEVKTAEDFEKYMVGDDGFEDLDDMTVDEYMKLYGNPDGKEK